jgi:hypothetical protein
MQDEGSRFAPSFDLEVWRWVGAALRSGALAAVAGIVVGSALGAVSFGVCAVVATVVFFLGWSAWQSERLAGAAVGAGLLGCVACVGAGIEIPRAWALEHAPRRHVRSVRDWAASDHAAVLVVDALGADEDARAYEGTPLVDRPGGPIVAFRCAVPTRSRHAGGRWLVPVALWYVDGFDECADGAQRTLERLRARGREVDVRAGERLFVAFEDGEAMAQAARPFVVFRAVVGLFVIFALAVGLFRRRGLEASAGRGS